MGNRVMVVSSFARYLDQDLWHLVIGDEMTACGFSFAEPSPFGDVPASERRPAVAASACLDKCSVCVGEVNQHLPIGATPWAP